MAEAFNGNIIERLLDITADDFDYTPGTRTAHARIVADIPNSFLKLMGMDVWPVVVDSEAVAGASGTRVLDVGMCIDITGSMQGTINAVKAQALSFEDDLNGELEGRGLPKFNAMRVRVIGYRDFSVATIRRIVPTTTRRQLAAMSTRCRVPVRFGAIRAMPATTATTRR